MLSSRRGRHRCSLKAGITTEMRGIMGLRPPAAARVRGRGRQAMLIRINRAHFCTRIVAGDRARPRSTGAAMQNVVGVPAYLQETYWWAYVHPNAVRLFERQWLVNLILWGNFA